MTNTPDEPVLPPEPGSVPDPDHGIPGDAEPLPDDDAKAVVAEDDAPEDYSDDDPSDEG